MQNNWKHYQKPDVETLKQTLDPLTFKVTQQAGTEAAGSHPLDHSFERGIYVDVLSGEPLFSSRDKYDSGCGWPAFTKTIRKEAVTEHHDESHGMRRTEIRSSVSDNHLGHVFNDGPRIHGGMRYCMNGVALRFVPEADMEKEGYGELLGEL